MLLIDTTLETRDHGKFGHCKLGMVDHCKLDSDKDYTLLSGPLSALLLSSVCLLSTMHQEAGIWCMIPGSVCVQAHC